MQSFCVRAALVLPLFFLTAPANAGDLTNLDAQLATAVGKTLEMRASHRLSLPAQLPELPQVSNASVPAAPARYAGADTDADATDSAGGIPTEMSCVRDAYSLRCRVRPLTGR
jgi:hypothetical protein